MVTQIKPTPMMAPTEFELNLSEIQESQTVAANNLSGKALFDYTEDFFTQNPSEYEKVKGLLKQVISKFSQDALNHPDFCSFFATPSRLPEVILKIIGLSEKQVAEAFYGTAHLYKGNAMHADPYYQVLLLLYFIGLKKDDQLFRLYVLTLIYAKIYNGRRISYFPNGCIPEVVSYIMTNNLRSSHSFKKYRTPFQLVVEYLAPSLDTTYAMRIRKDPFHTSDGLVKIMAQSWARVDQIFVGVKEHYYAAYNAGNKDIQVTTASGNENSMQEMVEAASEINKLAEKINRTLLIKKYTLDSENARLISRNIVLPQQYLDEVEKFLNDITHDDDDEGLKSIYEAALTAFGITDETGICNMNISMYSSKITGNQTDPKIGQFKKVVDDTCKAIFKNVFITQVYNQQQKIRRLVITMILFRMKAALCKNTKYDAI